MNMNASAGAASPPEAPSTENAFRPSAAAAEPANDGSWAAGWDEPDGRGGLRRRYRDGFQTQAAALQHARRAEMAARLNRC